MINNFFVIFNRFLPTKTKLSVFLGFFIRLPEMLTKEINTKETYTQIYMLIQIQSTTHTQTKTNTTTQTKTKEHNNINKHIKATGI